jgi:hypothetical protein
MITRRILFPRTRKPAAEPHAGVTLFPDDAIVQDDFGNWWIGLDDAAAGGFPTMQFAQAVAAKVGAAA